MEAAYYLAGVESLAIDVCLYALSEVPFIINQFTVCGRQTLSGGSHILSKRFQGRVYFMTKLFERYTFFDKTFHNVSNRNG